MIDDGHELHDLKRRLRALSDSSRLAIVRLLEIAK